MNTDTMPDYFENADEGIDENAPVENGELSLFELSSEMDRKILAQWADTIIPGIDIVALQQRVRVGDLVLNRPGSPAFEVYTRGDNASFERIQARLGILNIIGGDIDKAKDLDAWVHGDLA